MDATSLAAAAVRVVGRLAGLLSLRRLEKVLRGSRERSLLADGLDGLPEFGATRRLDAPAVSKLLRVMVAHDYLQAPARRATATAITVSQSPSNERSTHRWSLTAASSRCSLLLPPGPPSVRALEPRPPKRRRGAPPRGALAAGDVAASVPEVTGAMASSSPVCLASHFGTWPGA